MTFADEALTFSVDFLPPTKLVPLFDCKFPCNACLETDDSHCTTCWIDKDSTEKYFFDNGAKGQCLPSCPDGWTRDGKDSYICVPCDPSCQTLSLIHISEPTRPY